MSTLPKGCTCTVTLPDLYCPLHKAAPDLLAALKEITQRHMGARTWSCADVAQAAIDKAEEGRRGC